MTSAGTLAFYVPSLNVGGAERVTVTVANGLADRGYDIDLVTSYGGEFRDAVGSAVTVVDLNTPRVPGVGVGASLLGLSRYLRRTSPSLLFAQQIHASDVCLAAQLLSGGGTVVVPTIHNTVGMNPNWKETLTEWLAGTGGLGGRAGQFVAVSQGVADSIVQHLGVSPGEVSVLHNPVPVAEIQERASEPVNHEWLDSPDTEVVLSAGRLEEQKDLGTFLRAFARVRDRRPKARAVLAGSGSERENLERLANHLGIRDVVSFPGYVENPYGYMAGASVFAMSSVYEGLPTTLIEALACGCPVVSTDCPSGPDEILSGGEYGRLVGVGNHRALATAVCETLENPPSPERLLGRARAFSPEVVLQEYEAFVLEHGPLDVAPTATGTATPGQ